MIKTKYLAYTALFLLTCSLIALFPANASDGASALTPQDLLFKEWYNTTMNTIEVDATAMWTAIENYDCAGVESGAHSGYEAATKALDEIEGYEVSLEMQSVKTPLKLALEDFKAACNYAEMGAKEYNADDLETAARYVNTSLGYFEEVDALGLVLPPPVDALKRLQGDLEYAAKLVRARTPSPSPTATLPLPVAQAPEKGVLGFEAIFAIAGLLAVAYMVLKRR
jgi:hypothetical protein